MSNRTISGDARVVAENSSRKEGMMDAVVTADVRAMLPCHPPLFVCCCPCCPVLRFIGWCISACCSALIDPLVLVDDTSKLNNIYLLWSGDIYGTVDG